MLSARSACGSDASPRSDTLETASESTAGQKVRATSCETAESVSRLPMGRNAATCCTASVSSREKMET